ncbi:proteasome activator pa28, partial [Kipferlia bialata]
ASVASIVTSWEKDAHTAMNEIIPQLVCKFSARLKGDDMCPPFLQAFLEKRQRELMVVGPELDALPSPSEDSDDSDETDEEKEKKEKNKPKLSKEAMAILATPPKEVVDLHTEIRSVTRDIAQPCHRIKRWGQAVIPEASDGGNWAVAVQGSIIDDLHRVEEISHSASGGQAVYHSVRAALVQELGKNGNRDLLISLRELDYKEMIGCQIFFRDMHANLLTLYHMIAKNSDKLKPQTKATRHEAFMY